MKKLFVVCVALAACARSVSVNSEPNATATAQINNASGQQVATATLRQQSDGVRIDVVATGLSAGAHGIHIHAVGSCDAAGATPFASAGGHFNPAGKQHGLSNPNGSHGGDMPNINIGADGKGELHTVNNRVSLTTGANSLLDTDGSAIVIHAGADDQKTDPAGNSGGRVACGVIRQ